MALIRRHYRRRLSEQQQGVLVQGPAGRGGDGSRAVSMPCHAREKLCALLAAIAHKDKKTTRID